MSKPLISLIAAVSDDGVIGRKNTLPWRLSADLRYFKQRTMGKPIVMGRKTYDSIGKPLAGRKNIVVSRNSELALDGVIVVGGIDAALAECKDSEEIMIIGGAQLYEQCLPMAGRLYITRVHLKVPDGDARFPGLPSETSPDWNVSCRHFLAGEGNDPDCTFLVLDRVDH
ncbi:MAG: dihydrofolate reductase [Pseudomonadota bacterium]